MPDEYISRAAAIEEIDKWLDTVGTVLVGKGLSYYGELIGCIEDTPAADVAEVVHGRWIHHDDGVFTCSECGNAESNDSYYCRLCGAKMDGAAE